MGATNSALRAITGMAAPPPRREDIENQNPPNHEVPANGNGNAQNNNNNNLFLGPQFFRNDENGSSIDISSLGSMARRMAPPQMHQTTTVKCPVNLNRNSLQLIPEVVNEGENQRKKYRIQFLFDSTESGSIRIYYGATEERNAQVDGEEIEYRSLKCCNETRFERGLGQIYEQPPFDWIDPLLFTDENLLVHDLDDNYYPVVIVIQSDSGIYFAKNNSPTSTEKKPLKISSQTSFGDLIHCSDDSYVIKPIKQKISCSGRQFIVHDIFGLENGENETGKECVICMAEPRDTTVLPCRHLCLCSDCAEELRQQSNKCPICRSTVKHMVQIKIGKEPLKEEEDSDDDDDHHSKKNLVLESRTGGTVNAVEN